MISTMNEFDLINRPHSEIRPNYVPYNPFDIKKLPKLVEHTFFNNKKITVISVADSTRILRDIMNHWKNSDNVLEDSIQRYYFSKLIEILVEHHSEVILLKMPLTDYYYDNIPQKVKEEFIELTKRKDVLMLDLNDSLSISHEYKYFFDYGHLNKNGMSVVQDYLMRKEFNRNTGKLIIN